MLEEYSKEEINDAKEKIDKIYPNLSDDEKEDVIIYAVEIVDTFCESFKNVWVAFVKAAQPMIELVKEFDEAMLKVNSTYGMTSENLNDTIAELIRIANEISEDNLNDEQEKYLDGYRAKYNKRKTIYNIQLMGPAHRPINLYRKPRNSIDNKYRKRR